MPHESKTASGLRLIQAAFRPAEARTNDIPRIAWHKPRLMHLTVEALSEVGVDFRITAWKFWDHQHWLHRQDAGERLPVQEGFVPLHRSPFEKATVVYPWAFSASKPDTTSWYSSISQSWSFLEKSTFRVCIAKSRACFVQTPKVSYFCIKPRRKADSKDFSRHIWAKRSLFSPTSSSQVLVHLQRIDKRWVNIKSDRLRHEIPQMNI